MKKALVVVPENYKKNAGTAIVIDKYIPVVKRNYCVKIVCLNHKNVISVNNLKKLLNEVDFDIIIPFTMIPCYKTVKYTSNQNIYSFMIDCKFYGIVSEEKFNKKNKIKNDIKMKFKKKIRKYLYYFREKVISKYSKHVIYVSPSDGIFAEQKFKLNKEKIVILKNGYSCPLYYPKSISIRKKEGFIIGQLGNLHNIEDLKWFFEIYWEKILKMKPNIKFYLGGKCNRKLIKGYFDNISNTNFIGEVEKLEDFYKQIDISLITTRKSCGILNKILDSFANGIPVIGKENNFLSFDDAKEYQNYLIYRDASDFVKKISLIENDMIFREKMINNNYKLLKDNYEWKNVQKKFDKLI